MECRSCKEFYSCGTIEKFKSDLGLRDFMLAVKSNDPCMDYDERDVISRDVLKLYKNTKIVSLESAS